MKPRFWILECLFCTIWGKILRSFNFCHNLVTPFGQCLVPLNAFFVSCLVRAAGQFWRASAFLYCILICIVSGLVWSLFYITSIFQRCSKTCSVCQKYTDYRDCFEALALTAPLKLKNCAGLRTRTLLTKALWKLTSSLITQILSFVGQAKFSAQALYIYVDFWKGFLSFPNCLHGHTTFLLHLVHHTSQITLRLVFSVASDFGAVE